MTSAHIRVPKNLICSPDSWEARPPCRPPMPPATPAAAAVADRRCHSRRLREGGTPPGLPPPPARAVVWPCPGRVGWGESAWTSLSDRSSRTPPRANQGADNPRLAAPGDRVPLRAPPWFRKQRWPLVGSSHARTPRTRARAHRHARLGRARGEGSGGGRGGRRPHRREAVGAAWLSAPPHGGLNQGARRVATRRVRVPPFVRGVRYGPRFWCPTAATDGTRPCVRCALARYFDRSSRVLSGHPHRGG